MVGIEWSSVATVWPGRRTRSPRSRRPSNACGLVTSWTRCRSMPITSGAPSRAGGDDVVVPDLLDDRLRDTGCSSVPATLADASSGAIARVAHRSSRQLSYSPGHDDARRLRPARALPRPARRPRSRRRARDAQGHRLHRRGPLEADRRRRHHLDRDDAVQLQPARAGRARQGRHSGRRRDADGVQHDRRCPTASAWAPRA